MVSNGLFRPDLVITVRIDRVKGAESRVIDQNIEAAEMSRRFVHHSLDIVMVENIQTPGMRVPALGLDFIEHARDSGFIYIGNRYERASAANK